LYHYANTIEVLVIALFTSIAFKLVKVTLESQFLSAEWWLMEVDIAIDTASKAR
jgi:hypothetical protein